MVRLFRDFVKETKKKECKNYVKKPPHEEGGMLTIFVDVVGEGFSFLEKSFFKEMSDCDRRRRKILFPILQSEKQDH